MGTDFETRKQELIDESEVSSSMFNQVSDRLKEFMVPFVSSLVRREQVDHAHTLVQGVIIGFRAQEHGNDRLSFWSTADAAAVVYGGLGLGSWCFTR